MGMKLLARGESKAFLAVWNGEVWRLATAMFLHGGWLHLLLNMYGLYFLGHAVEQSIGHWRFLVVYFVAGIFGFIVSLIFLHPCVPTLGASGAIFGLIGALIGDEMRWGRHPLEFLQQDHGRSLVTFAVANLVLGFAFPQINNSAHIAGFIMGLLLMQVGLVRLRRPLNGRGWLLRVAGIILCFEVTVYSFFPVFNGYWQYQRFLEAVARSEVQEARQAKDLALRLEPELPEDPRTRQILEEYGLSPKIGEEEAQEEKE